ncbi:hypothetical protein [Paludibacterium denitrificans]|uniref:hypothetical protein n=1 Tax=Paludibacterium denitrificans TaxID=2675226 RepID=UPI0028AFEDD7|nr:hypothetical protein [Paludibacterium denitrificans]
MASAITFPTAGTRVASHHSNCPDVLTYHGLTCRAPVESRFMKFPLALITGLLVLHGAAQADTPSGIGKEGFDPTVRPQDDIYHAVNGSWIKQTVLPPEEAHIGAFKTLYDLNQLRSRQIIENAAAHPTDSAEAQKIGDLYHSFMGEARIERPGLTPLQPQLARVAALRNKAQLVALLGQWQSEPLETPLGLYVEPDAKNSRATLAGVYQSGLAMPDRDYYLEKDARFEHARQGVSPLPHRAIPSGAIQPSRPARSNGVSAGTATGAVAMEQGRQPRPAKNL